MLKLFFTKHQTSHFGHQKTDSLCWTENKNPPPSIICFSDLVPVGHSKGGCHYSADASQDAGVDRQLPANGISTCLWADILVWATWL